jgi:hypothetical protein
MENLLFQFMNGANTKDASWMKQLPPTTENVSQFHLEEFFRTMFERQEIWYKRNILKERIPWSEDKILRDYKFTNVYRELDRASQWLIKNVLLDNSLSLEDLLFRIIIFRFYNQPDTFSPVKQLHWDLRVELPHYEDFDAKKLWDQTIKYRKHVDNPWHTAYMMNIAFLPKPKEWDAEMFPEYGLFKDYAYCVYLFTEIYMAIPKLVNDIKTCSTADGLLHALESLPATGSFQAHEFYIDLCYVSKYWKEPIMKWDQNSTTNGCSLGLRLVFPSLTPREQIQGIYWLKELAEEQLVRFGQFKYVEWNRETKTYDLVDKCNITLHQCEMFLCEYQKYWKMSIKQGKQRSKFIPKTK